MAEGAWGADEGVPTRVVGGGDLHFVETVQGWFSEAGDEGVSANEFGSRDVNEVHDVFVVTG